MKYETVEKKLAEARVWLQSIYDTAYQQASVEIGGNWQDPDVRLRRRTLALSLADLSMKHFSFFCGWHDHSVETPKQMERRLLRVVDGDPSRLAGPVTVVEKYLRELDEEAEAKGEEVYVTPDNPPRLKYYRKRGDMNVEAS